MDQTVKQKWLKALRSGKYKQGRDYLATSKDPDARKPQQFCCLGVLCDLYARAEKLSWEYSSVGHTGVALFSLDGGTGILPESVLKWAGLDEVNPEVATQGGPLSLAELNDGAAEGDSVFKKETRAPLSFAEIASIIEEQL